MSARTQRVDAMAVMDKLIALAHQCITFVPPEGPTCAEHNAEYEETASRWLLAREARASFAELIEAAREVETDAKALGMTTNRLTAALSALAGGASHG